MISITPEILMRAGIRQREAAAFSAPLQAACERFGITTAPRLAGFLAQVRVESAGFTQLTESLAYSPARLVQVFPSRVPTLADAQALVRRGQEAVANVVYAGKLGNGAPASGDGWRYRGRGLKQLTGRDNYAAAGLALSRPYLADPDLVAQPADACLTAAWFWISAKCDQHADAHRWDAITRAVNGSGMLQAEARRAESERLLTILA